MGIVVGFICGLAMPDRWQTVRSEFVSQYPDAPRAVFTYVTNLPVGGREVHGIIEEGERYTALHYCGWNFDVYPHPKEIEFFTDLCRRMSGLEPYKIKLIPKNMPWIPDFVADR